MPRDFTLQVEGGIIAGSEVLVATTSCLVFSLLPDLDLQATSSSGLLHASVSDEGPTDDPHSSEHESSGNGSSEDSDPPSGDSLVSGPGQVGQDNPQECSSNGNSAFFAGVLEQALVRQSRAEVSPAVLTRFLHPAWLVDESFQLTGGWHWPPGACALQPPPPCWTAVQQCEDPIGPNLKFGCLDYGFIVALKAELAPSRGVEPLVWVPAPWDPICAKQPDDAGARTAAGTVLPDLFDRAPAPPGPRDGPTYPVGVERIVNEIVHGNRFGDDQWIHAMFLIMAPDTLSAVVSLPLQAPCSVPDALEAVAQLRDDNHSTLYPELYVAEPQPSCLFACLLAAPAWAQQACCILIDTRAFDGRLFSVTTHSRINRESLILAAGLPVSDQVAVYCHTRIVPLQQWQMVELTTGSAVTFCPAHLPTPRRPLLEHMLLSPRLWDPDADIPQARGVFFQLLTDGMPQLHTQHPQRSQHYREAIAQALCCEESALTLRPSAPRLFDVLFKGYIVRAVVVATAAISRIPVPPGRVLPPKHVLILDCRPILLSFQWLLIPALVVKVQDLVDRFTGLCPDGFIVSIQGAEVVNDTSEAAFQLHDGHLLRVAFVQNLLSESSSDQLSSPRSSRAFLSDAMSADSAAVAEDRHAQGPASARSRSPRPSPPPAGTHEVHSSSSGSLGLPSYYCQRVDDTRVIPCFIFSVGYETELVMVQPPLRQDSMAISDAVHFGRSGPRALQGDLLLPVPPLDGFECLFFVAVPPWAARHCVVCIDTLALNGRAYACLAPAVVDIFGALGTTGFPLAAELDIFVDGATLPLRDGEEVGLQPGSRLRFVPRGSVRRPDQLLADLLSECTCSCSAAVGEAHGNGDAHLLVHDDTVCFYRPEPARFGRFDEDAAALLGGDPMCLTTLPADPGVSDASFRGQPCPYVTACTFRTPVGGDNNDLMVLVDCRRLLRGWFTSWTHDGFFDVAWHVSLLAHSAPYGYMPVCEGHVGEPECVPARAGQVFVFFFEPAACRSGDSPGLPSLRITGDDDGEGSPGGEAPEKGGPTPQSKNAPPPCQLPADSGPLGLAHSWSVPLGDLRPLGIAGIQVLLLLLRLVSTACLRLHAAIIACPPAAAYLIWVCLAPYLGGGPYEAAAVQMPLSFGALGPPADPMQTDWLRSGRPLADVGTVDRVELSSRLPCQYHGVSRPLPTPVRAFVRCAAVPAFAPGTPSSDDAAANEEVLRTLLDEAVPRDGPTAFFQTATLLDTLLEHFAEFPSRMSGRASALEAPADRQLAIGRTPLGFTPLQASAFRNLPNFLVPIEELYSSATPLIQKLPNLDSLRTFACQLQTLQRSASNEVWCYTDGSYTPSSRSRPSRLGWAVVFVEPGVGRIQCSWGAVPKELVTGSSEGSAFLAECFALLAAALLGASDYPGVLTHFLSDCQSALAVIPGAAQYTLGGVPEAACHAHSYLRQVKACSDTFDYVPGHAGIAPNELVDVLAKKGALQCSESCGLQLSHADMHFWLGGGGARLSWLGTVLRSQAGDVTLPPVNLPLGADTNHGGLSPIDLIAPFVPSAIVCDGMLETPATTLSAPCQLKVRIATFNVLSLLDGTPSTASFSGAGLHDGPARATVLAAALEHAGIQIAFLQETRGPKGSSRAGCFHRFASGGSRGQWGTEIWVHRSFSLFSSPCDKEPPAGFPSSAVVTLQADPRRLILRIAFPPITLLLAALHGPNRATERSVISEWWQDTLQYLTHFCKADHVIVAGDMNAAVGSVPGANIGDFAPEVEDEAGTRIRDLASRLRLWCPATFAENHQGPTHTYHQKKNGRLCRPDMILLPLQWARGRVVSFTDPTIHAGHVTQDHVAACAEVSLDFARPQRSLPTVKRRIRAADLASPDLRSQVQAVILSTPRVSWDTSVHAHAAIVTKHLQEGLSGLSVSRPRRPTHPYVQDDTWELQRQVARLRRAIHHRQARLRYHMLLTCLQVWRDCSLSFETAYLDNRWAKQMTFSLHVQVHHLKSLGGALRASLRRDRNTYVEELALQFSQGPSNKLFSAYHKLLVHKRKQPYHLEPLPSINQANGHPCASSEDTFSRWREHFGGLEAGIPTNFLALSEQACARSDEGLAAAWPHPEHIDAVPSLTFLSSILAATKTNKASGMDGLPPELCRYFSEVLAPVLHPLILKQVWRGSEPLGWKGGMSIFFHKRKGSVSECSSYRSVLLLSSLAKASHQSLRPPLKQLFERSAPSLQMGGRAGFSVAFGSHLLRSVTRLASQQGKSSFVLFADIASAFYSAVTQLTAGGGEAVSEALIRRLVESLQLAPEDAATLCSRITDQSAMASAGATAWLERLTDMVSSNNWFLLRGDSTPIATARGSRPGSSFADLVFALLVPRILQDRDSLRADTLQKSLPHRFPWDGCVSLAPCASDAPSIAIEDIVWADDIAIPRLCDSGHHVRAAVTAETSSLADACSAHGLCLSFGPYKTAAVLTVTGSGSRAARRQLFGRYDHAGELLVLREHASAAKLALVSTYKHLGAFQAPFGRMQTEIQYRISQARAAYHEARRKIYKNRAIRVARKSILLESTVLSRLLQGAGAWPKLLKGEQRSFEAAVWSFYRGILCIPRAALQSITALTCCALVNLPSPSTLLRRARLLYLRQLVTSGPPQLWAVVKADGDYTSLLAHDLQWMHHWVHATAPLPDPVTGWDTWVLHMRDRPGVYKGLVKRACKLDSCRVAFVAALDGLHRGLLTLSGAPAVRQTAQPRVYEHMCLPCKRAFASKVAWSGHSARLHGYRSTAFILGEGCLCRSCGKSFSSAGRLRRHLTSVPACIGNWGAFEPVETSVGGKGSHVQAPPQPEDGSLQPVPREHLSGVYMPLLQDLEQLTECPEEEVWSTIEEHIAPLPLLRETVKQWGDRHCNSTWHQTIAENMLLLLDPSVTAEHFPEVNDQPRPNAYTVPAWQAPDPLCFNITGSVQLFRLEPPPAITLELDRPTSVPLKSASALLLWTEDACRVIVTCASQALSHPVRLACPGIWSSLPVVRTWLEAQGFLCDDAGFRTPL